MTGAVSQSLVLMLLPLAPILTANWSVSPPRGSEEARTSARLVTLALLGLIALSPIALIYLGAHPGVGGRAEAGEVILFLTGSVAALLLTRRARALVARIAPIDSDNLVHATALVIAVVLLGSQLAAQVTTDVLRAEANSGTARLSRLDLVLL
jgi:hypothetical protein